MQFSMFGNLHTQGCMQKFCKGEGELGVFKKRGGRSCKQRQGSLVFLRGGESDTRRGGANAPRLP